MSLNTGGIDREYVGEADTEALVKYVDGIYLKFGASNRLYGVNENVEELCQRASLAELRLTPVPIRHLGTEHCYSVLKAMRDELVTHVEFKLGVTASTIIVEDGVLKGVEREAGDRFLCRYLRKLTVSS